jgi:hypothetical protein
MTIEEMCVLCRYRDQRDRPDLTNPDSLQLYLESRFEQLRVRAVPHFPPMPISLAQCWFTCCVASGLDSYQEDSIPNQCVYLSGPMGPYSLFPAPGLIQLRAPWQCGQYKHRASYLQSNVSLRMSNSNRGVLFEKEGISEDEAVWEQNLACMLIACDVALWATLRPQRLHV